MARTLFGSRTLAGAIGLAMTVAFAAPTFAQSTGMVKGKVVDAEGKPVDGAKITIEFAGGVSRKHETKTNKKGEYLQIGLAPGPYKLTADKDNLGSQTFDATVRLGGTAEVNFRLAPGVGPRRSREGRRFKKAFDEGVAFSRSNAWDEAIAKFAEAAASRRALITTISASRGIPGRVQGDRAEARAAEAHNGLATVYNARRN
jgi:hypothetical protein